MIHFSEYGLQYHWTHSCNPHAFLITLLPESFIFIKPNFGRDENAKWHCNKHLSSILFPRSLFLSVLVTITLNISKISTGWFYIFKWKSFKMDIMLVFYCLPTYTHTNLHDFIFLNRNLSNEPRTEET